MFSHHNKVCKQCGQCDLGIERVNVVGDSSALDDKASARHWRSSIRGVLWMTTFKKLPKSKPIRPPRKPA